jgi:hypothetical protein
MRDWIRGHLTYANVMASIAVFIALAGGAYAATGLAGSGGVINACAPKNGGPLVVLKPGKRCARKYVSLPIDQRGKPGRNGTNGTNGKAGTNGTNGSDGKGGATGPVGLTGSTGPQGPGASGFYFYETASNESSSQGSPPIELNCVQTAGAPKAVLLVIGPTNVLSETRYLDYASNYGVDSNADDTVLPNDLQIDIHGAAIPAGTPVANTDGDTNGIGTTVFTMGGPFVTSAPTASTMSFSMTVTGSGPGGACEATVQIVPSG